MSVVLADEPAVAPAPAQPGVAEVDLALRTGALLMQSGVSTDGAAAATRDALAALGVGGARLIFTGDAVMATAGADPAAPLLLRPIPALGANLARATGAQAAVERLRRGALDVDGFRAELERLAALPAPYPPALTAAALGAAGFAFNQLLGGAFVAAGVVFVANAAAHVIRQGLNARKLAPALVTLITALAASIIAALGVRLGLAPAAASTFIPAITLLIPGFALINGLLDLFGVRHVMVGAQRLLAAGLTFLLIGIGMAIGIAVAGG